MTTRINHRKSNLMNAFSVLAILALSIGMSVSLSAQDELYGPQNPPPKLSAITSSHPVNEGQIGRAGGMVYTITNITLANSTTVYWTMLEDAVKLSMDGPEYLGSENMTISPGHTNLTGGIITWIGFTQMPLAAGGTRSLYSKFIMTVYDLDNNPVSLIDPSVTGLPAGSGGAVLITANTMVFKVKLEMFVSETLEGTYIPHLDYYDPAPTPPAAESAYSTYDFGFYWENDPPELTTNLGISVDEGDSVYIDNIVLVAEDVESTPEELKFILDPRNDGLLPAHGTLQFDSVDMVLPDTISMADIVADSLVYIHDGSETEKDSIAFMIVDSDNVQYKVGEDSVFFVMIAITPVDDPPTVAANTGATLDEEAEIVITTAMLSATDPESSDDAITYTLDPESASDYPINGLLKLSDIPLSDAGTFTQQDIADGKLTYTHDGTETLLDGFLFRVTDEYDHLATNNEDPDFFFEISIDPVNDSPIFSKNLPLEVPEGGTAVISNTVIGAMDEESDAAEIIFTIDPDLNIPDPLHGQIFLDAVELGHGDSFTMDDVNNTLVTYKHDDSETSADFIPIGISDPDGGVASDGGFTVFHFNITILPENDVPTVANPMSDQTTRADSPYSFTVPENTFEDQDPGDSFTYDAYQGDGSALPSWLDFDKDTRIISGTPPLSDKGAVYIIVVEAEDSGEMGVTDDFALEITSPVGLEATEEQRGIRIYPNPFTNQVQLSVSESFASEVNIRIINVLGECVLEIMEKPGSDLQLDMSAHPSGLYFIRVDDGEKEYNTRIMKR